MRRTLEDFGDDRTLIGESPAMRPVLDKIQRVAQSLATVLITGQSGTGKELIARAIHAASPRAEQPMLCVNCAALSPTRGAQRICRGGVLPRCAARVPRGDGHGGTDAGAVAG